MKTWRRIAYPPEPRTLQELAQQLGAVPELLLQYHSGELTTVTLRDANNDVHIGFYDETFLRHVEEDITTYLTDSTYQTTPDMDQQLQLLTLMGVFHGHVGLASYSIKKCCIVFILLY